MNLTIRCDASPLRLFIKLFEAALQGRKGSLNVGDLGFELARVEDDVGAADAGEMVVRVYPSDAFLRFAVTVFAGDADFGVVEDADHVLSMPKLFRDEGKA